jgi:hypothetical protein
LSSVNSLAAWLGSAQVQESFNALGLAWDQFKVEMNFETYMNLS